MSCFAQRRSIAGFCPRGCIVLVAMLVALCCACVSHAQVGPPVPGSNEGIVVNAASGQASRLLDMDRSSDALTSDFSRINPLEVLDSAGAALPSGQSRSMANTGGRSGLSTAVNILVVLTIVSLAPSIMLMCTSFVRILVVLGLLRQAMGTQSIPPPQVITALAMFMTLMVMTPTLDRINKEAITPYRQGQVQSYDELWQKGSQPVRDFMFAQIDATGNWSSVYMLLEYRGVDVADPSKLTRADVDMVTLVPAYMLSELKTAFLMGFRVYLPFLVIDMVISTMLISMSMMMLPPVLISLPFKLLLFVLVDGWALVVGGLLHSFAQPVVGTETAMLLQAVDPSLMGTLGAQAHELAVAIASVCERGCAGLKLA